jgi:hypothetical protein
MYLKSLASLEKAPISLKKSLKILEIFIKAAISQKMYSNSLVIFIKSSYQFKKPPVLQFSKAFISFKMYIKKASKSFKMSHIAEKNLHLSGNNFKKPQIL